jgi:hypothetical protein
MVTWTTLLTCVAACLIGSISAAPLDAPSVLLPLSGPSIPQPTVEYFHNNIYIGEPDDSAVSMHLALRTIHSLLTPHKEARSLPGINNSIQIILQKNSDKYEYYYMFYQGRSGITCDPCGWASNYWTQIAQVGPFTYSMDIMRMSVFPPTVSLSFIAISKTTLDYVYATDERYRCTFSSIGRATTTNAYTSRTETVGVSSSVEA